MLPIALADPNVAFVLLVLGLLGVYWEFHAPGMAVPGILGALFICLGAYGVYQDRPTWYGVTLIAVAALLLLIELKYYTHMVSGVAGSILLALGAILLLQGPHRVTPLLAAAVAISFGIITVFLGYLGMSARTQKPAIGIETLVGEIGEARTGINPEGTVFVHGEYWHARSNQPIAAGKRIAVEKVKNLVVFVKEA